MGPPVGLIHRPDGTIDLDPDAQVQGALRLVFETFERTGSAMRTVHFFQEQGILFPRRLRTGPGKGELRWAPPRHSRILQVLHNPRYAGAFVYGRTRTRHLPDGGISVIRMPKSEWQFVMQGMHPGYIDWDRFEGNPRRLADNARAFGGERRSGPPREGPALPQGRVLCGLCGERMGVRYSQEQGQTVFVCPNASLLEDSSGLCLSGDVGPSRREGLPNGSRQACRCGAQHPAGRADDAYDPGGYPGRPA
jgi:hypothetical protein